MNGTYRWFHVLVLSTIATAIAGSAGGGEPRSVMPPQRELPADILLAPGGQLSGRVMDSARIPRTGCRTQLWRQGRLVAVEQTAVDGGFMFSNLNGGLYRLVVADRVFNCRLWSAPAAPPCAVDELVVSVGNEVVRGQNYNPFPYPRSFRTAMGITGIGALAWGIWELADKETPPAS
jgi:hypothetical protein